MNNSTTKQHPLILVKLLLAGSVLCCLNLGNAKPPSAPETTAKTVDNLRIVVSARSLKEKGRSFWRLYLYRGNGSLIDTITDDGSDAKNPVFSPDGKTIAFSKMPVRPRNSSDADHSNIFLINTDGSHLKKYDGPTTAPSWYTEPVSMETVSWDRGAQDFATTSPTHKHSLIFPDPTSRFEFIMATLDSLEEPGFPSEDRPAWIRDMRTNSKDSLSSLTGYGASVARENHESAQYGFMDLLYTDKGPWISLPNFLTIAFFSHMNSSDKSANFILDPKEKRIHEVGPNGASIYVPRDLSAIFIVSYKLYQTIGNSDFTANFSFLDLWTQDFKRRRLSPPNAVFGGASVWNPDKREVQIIRDE